ncbi:unnamed protein product [Rotaria magnacalcarata]|uniref:Uncharacterized protein n=1 Tax=Rotaria magnacalcarata TaxID=392030 RepID=A0A8S2L588_9BILA|nr:unnamed protein product [Rotaria magnacalcarata]CAF3853852.1 unnamed protein product [Rotaria magnacalcarata]CAF3885546.1 unnamed protein product [Rotaria magnacalcarata]
MGCNHGKFVTTAVVVNQSSASPAIDIQHNEPPVVTGETRFTTTADSTILINDEKINLESHQLVWLDEKTSEQISENIVTIESLRKIVDYTKLFDNVEECRQYLENSKDHNDIFLVTSGQSGEKLIPEVHRLQNVLLIYVYCQDKEYHEQWASKYQKVKKVHGILDQLLMELREDVQNYSKSNNEVELKYVEEFHRDYTPKQAIWWYTRETFIYRMLNAALRQCDIKTIVLFGFFIQDVYHQLKEEHKKFLLLYPKDSIIKCYRGQVMSYQELRQLDFQDGGPKTIVNTSLFSTSINRDVPFRFLSNVINLQQLEYVIFEIEVDTRLQTRPFADISHLSACSDESEILFMIGAWLLIERNGVSYSYEDNKKIWTIKSTLTNDWQLKYEQYLEMTTQKEHLQKCLRRISLHIYHATPNDVEVAFNELLDLYPSERWILALKKESLGDNQSEISHNRSAALEYYQKALEIWSEYVNDDELNADYDIVRIYWKIATNNADSIMAMKYSDLAIVHSQPAFAKVSTNYERYRLHGWMAVIYKEKANISTGDSEKSENLLATIKYTELQLNNLIELQCTTAVGNYDNLTALCYIELGALYQSVLKYNEAITNYGKALEFELAKLDPDYERIDQLTRELVEIYSEKKNDYNAAFKYESLNHEYLLKQYMANPTKDYLREANRNYTLACSYAALATICRKMQRYDLAAENLTKTIESYGNSLHYDRYALMSAHEDDLMEINKLLASSKSAEPTS